MLNVQENVNHIYRSTRPEVSIGKGVLKTCSKFTVEHPYQSVISIKLQSNFIEIAVRHGFSPVNLLHIFRTPFPKNCISIKVINKTQQQSEAAEAYSEYCQTSMMELFYENS